jgi:5-methylcytosine-specific restriction endonuclease McrA
MPKEKAPPCDGLGPRERKKIDQAIRQTWYRCKARQLCVKRNTDSEGYTVCQSCRLRTPKLKIDHIIPCGPVDSDGFIKRLFCSSSGLQGLCHECHKKKTKQEIKSKKSRDQSLHQEQTLGVLPGQLDLLK